MAVRALLLGLLVATAAAAAGATAPGAAPASAPDARAAPGPDARAAIVNGDLAGRDSAPWTVAILTHGVVPRRGWYCGGALVAPQAVVTAAHCVVGEAPRDVDVLAGRRRLSGTGGRRVRVERIGIAPGWGPLRGAPDVAVLRLERPVDDVRTAVLPKAGSARPGRAGRRALVSGWGLRGNRSSAVSDDLRVARVTVRRDRTCRKVYRSFFRPGLMLCANDRRARQDTCRGDSGGPLVATLGGLPTLVGVVSFGREYCAEPTAPGGYAEVASVSDWIAARVALPLDGPEPDDSADGDPVTRIERYDCGRVRCTVAAAVRGRKPARVVLRVRRARGGGAQVVRTVRMIRTSAFRYRAKLRLPRGVLGLSVLPQDDSGGRVGRADTIIVVAR